MNFIEKSKMLERVDQLIRMKATGTAGELAKKLNQSRSSVYNTLDLLRDMGADIKYCESRKSYYYTTDKILAIGYKKNK